MIDLPIHLRRVVEHFEDNWQQDTPPDVESFLRRCPKLDETTRHALLVRLVMLDVDYRWQRRTNVPVRELEEYTALGPMDSWPDELIVAAFRSRRRAGDSATADGYLGRFGSRADRLRRKLIEAEAEFPTVDGAAAASLPGETLPTIDGYEILGELGHGGFGVVYQARRPGLEGYVALKTLLPSARRQPHVVARFEDEARIISRLTHDHIIRILQIDRSEGLPVLVLEFLEGGTLSTRLAQQPMSIDEAVSLTVALADALEAAHEAGVIHRDLKPANVLFDGRGRPKITDFGLARRDGGGHTLSDAILGTPDYMSPEQARGNAREVTHASDIYSLGTMLYRMLTGRVPFRGSPQEVMRKVIEDTPEPIGKLKPDVPRDLVTICDKCLEKEPRDRFMSAAQLRDELRRFQRGEPLSIRPPGALVRMTKWVRRKPAAAAICGLVLLAGVLLTFGVIASVLGWRAETARDNEERAKLELARQKQETDDAYEREKTAKARESAARKDAESARDEADRLKGIAQQRQRERYQYQHLAVTGLLPHLWREGNHFEMTGLLKALEPEPGDEDLRGFETHYWRRALADLRVFDGHGTVTAFAMAPTAGLIATGSDDRRVLVRDLKSGKLVQTLTGHQRPITGLAWSGDASRLVSVASDIQHPEKGGELRIWDVAAGKETARSDLPQSVLSSVAFAPDGAHIVTGGASRALFGITGDVKVWDTSAKVARNLARNNKQLVFALAFSADGSRMASGASPGANGAGEVVLWNTSTWQAEKNVGQHASGIWSLAFVDNDRLVTAGIDRVARLWDLASNSELQEFKGHSRPVRHAALSPDATRLATASFDGTARLWNVKNGQELATLRGHAGFVSGVGFTADGQQLVTAGVDGTVRTWDGTAGARYVVDLPSRPAGFAHVAFGPEDRLLAWSSGNNQSIGELGVWDLAAGKTLMVREMPRLALAGLAFSPDGKTLAVGGVYNAKSPSEIQLWDVPACELRQTLKGQVGLVSRIVYTPDGGRLITAAQDRSIMVWDTAGGARERVLNGHQQSLFALAVTKDGLLASGGGIRGRPGGELKFWNLADGEQRKAPAVAEGVVELAFAPDGKSLAVATFSEKATVFDVARLEPVLELDHALMAVSIAYSPDGRRLATGSFDGSVAIWETKTGKRLLTLTGHTMPVVSVAFSPSGLYLASADGSGKVKLWAAR